MKRANEKKERRRKKYSNCLRLLYSRRVHDSYKRSLVVSIRFQALVLGWLGILRSTAKASHTSEFNEWNKHWTTKTKSNGRAYRHRAYRFKSRFCVAISSSSSTSSSTFSWLLCGPMASASFALCVNESHNAWIFLCGSFASLFEWYSHMSLCRYVWHYVLCCTGNCCFGW